MGLSGGRAAPCRRRPPAGQAPRRRGAALKLLGIVGWSGSGKTTLIEALLPRLGAAGLRVSTIKHAHHGLVLDREGKDSWRHARAGAEEVMVAGGAGWMLLRHGEEADPARLAARLAPVDLVLVEGFKSYPFPKLEVHRPALGRPPLWPDLAGVAAVASDADLPRCPLPVLPLADPDAIATWIGGLLRRVGAPA